MTIFDHGASLVPDIVTEAEEERVLLRISQAPWLTDLSRRVQHYGFRRSRTAKRGSRNQGEKAVGSHAPAAPSIPRLGRPSLPDRLAPLLRRPPTRPVHHQRVAAGPGDRHARRSPVFRRHGRSSLCRSDAAWTMNFRPRNGAPRRPRWGWRPTRSSFLPRRSALVLRGQARSTFMHGIDTRRQYGHVAPLPAFPPHSHGFARGSGDTAVCVRAAKARSPKQPGRHRGGRQNERW